MEPITAGPHDSGSSKHFKRMTKLRILNVRRTKFTENGVKDLRRALPNVELSIGP